MRIKAAVVPMLAALTGVVAQATASPPPPTVPCADIIGRATSDHDDSYRRVLGVVSAPPAYLPQVIPTRMKRWAYWRKAGLVVRAGNTSIGVSVPKAWRNRVAITWGNGTGIVSSLRIAACPSPPHVWNAYAGGFYLRSRSACVPLTFRVGPKKHHNPLWSRSNL